MPQPFYERLADYYAAVGNVLRGRAAAASIFPNSTDIGGARESIYAEFLEHHLPPGCHVMKGGFLFDLDGNESAQIDLIVTNDAPLQFNMFKEQTGNKSFSCVDGCLAAVSVKSNMDSAALSESLSNLAGIPRVETETWRHHPSVIPDNYEFWPLKIAFASKGASLGTLCQTLADFYTSNPNIPPTRRVDIVHVAGVGAILAIGHGFVSAYQGSTGNPYVAVEDSTDIGALALTIQNIQVYHAHSRVINYCYGDMLGKIMAHYAKPDK